MAPFADSTVFAQILGYLVGVGSFALYSPIILRLWRQKQKAAEGLVLSTWWLKLTSYTASDIYYINQGYNLSTYIETLILALEAAVVLCLVAYYQTLANHRFKCQVTIFLAVSILLLLTAPIQLVALGQGISAVLNTGALIPQFILNHRRQKAGDYSPITAGLATIGCLIRLFTTVQLNDADGLLIATFGSAALVNASLMIQICYLGTQIEGRTLSDVLTADGRRSAETEFDEADNCQTTPYHKEEDIALVGIQENSPLTERRQN
ncbi:unnamed protein product [Cylindrotheca closterium]|uniref:Mannose-P-dolichol utilization defect 1 protein homolog n=1 Tax=Cylindrotheca closterium TaxID=2856 RepID=A0AAD2FIZ1_9STRA|nr:unnamed protein product [Cylindrotheca closterium]